MQQSHEVGDIVKLSSGGQENENYAQYIDVPLRITNVSTKYMPSKEFFAKGKPKGFHPGFDDLGFALYDLETLTGASVPFSLYDWENMISTARSNGCIYTDAQHVWDTPHYAMLGSDNVCEACIKADFAEEYLESLENTNAALTMGIDPAQNGYEIVASVENGNMQKSYDELRTKHKRLLFVTGRWQGDFTRLV
ncbi:unnamed protein product [Sphagnum tenellum]